MRAKTWLTKLPLLACIGIFLFHFWVIAKYAVNIPHFDDWALIAGDNHPASIDLHWLRAQHNEHRPATLRLFVWLEFHINRWNVRTHQLLNFICYGLILALLVWLARQFAPQVPTWLVLSFIIFLLSPIIWWEHFMAFPTSVHFWLLFFIVSVSFMFTERQKWPALIAGSVASILSIYSIAAGFVTSLILLVTFSIFKGVRAHRATDKKSRRRELLQLLLVVGLIGSALGVWIAGYVHPPHHPPLVLPYTWTFWAFLFNLVAFSFGVDQISTEIGFFVFLIVVVPICGLVWQARGKLSTAQWAICATLFGFLANLCAITIGRAGFGIGASKIVEYAEHGLPLIILSVLAWSIFLQGKKILQIGFLVALWFFCFATSWDNWDFDIYRKESETRMQSVRCVKAYYEQTGDGRCPTTFPADRSLAPFLEQAKRLNASFYRDLHLSLPATANYFGVLSAATCEHITGWAYDPENPNSAIDVVIYDGDLPVTTVRADNFLPGVRQAGFGTGLYGFDFPPPAGLKDNQPHSIRVKFSGTARDLLNSPQILTCAQP